MIVLRETLSYAQRPMVSATKTETIYFTVYFFT